METRGFGVRKSSLCHAWGSRLQAVGAGMQQLHSPRYCLKQKWAGKPSFHEELEKNTLPLNSGEIQVPFKRGSSKAIPSMHPKWCCYKGNNAAGAHQQDFPPDERYQELSVCLSVQHPPYPGTEGLHHARLLREKPKEWIKAKAIKARHKTNNTTLFRISYKRFTELNRINR